MTKVLNVVMHNDKEYLYYHVGWGSSIEVVVTELIKESVRKKQLFYTQFNETIIYSDEVSLDSAYKEITGKGYNEFQIARKREHEEILRLNAEYEQKIPELTKFYIEKGHQIIAPSYWNKYDEIVDASLHGMYKGFDLDCALELIQMLNNNDKIFEVEKKMNLQSHSGWSASVVRMMVKDLCDRGIIFFEATV